MTDLYSIPLHRIDGAETTLAPEKGDVLLIVNVASKCGLTPQYAGLEALYEAHRGEGFAVLGFPCNQFAGQEPGTEAEIATFCETMYGVKFPLFAKLDVKGEHQHPLYRLLTAAQPERILPAGKAATPGTDVRWNFEKFLVSRTGAVVARFDPAMVPSDPALVRAVEAELAKPA